MKCDFCGAEGDWKCVIRDTVIAKADGSEILVCDDYLNLYANGEWEELTKKIQESKDAI